MPRNVDDYSYSIYWIFWNQYIAVGAALDQALSLSISDDPFGL